VRHARAAWSHEVGLKSVLTPSLHVPSLSLINSACSITVPIPEVT
jgi:hypothetical protein